MRFWTRSHEQKQARVEDLTPAITQALHILEIRAQKSVRPLDDQALSAIAFVVLRNEDPTRTNDELAEAAYTVDKIAWRISNPIRFKELKDTGMIVQKALQIGQDKLEAMGKRPDGGRRLFGGDVEEIIEATKAAVTAGHGLQH